ncbi:MAG: tRNA lysidine(34) synthetase TilS [Candidatus Omnitrophica bacterium]|nr:tRNA lysidine(34) synthetase TilS [Candidatus Omnitrophota bacterium]
MKNNIVEKVLKTMRSYDMVKSGDTVLAAVSGGPDSILLLHLLARLKNKLRIKEIVVCNLDHGIRGKESSDDSMFVKKYSATLGLKFIHKKIKLRSAKTGGLSMEEAAREARYIFFNNAAASVGADSIATGHTLDDQAETVLMRILKGASLKGLVGISPVRSEGSFRMIRPLIELEKTEITDYLDAESIPYRIDSTNAEPIYFRNVIRGEIMPFLEKYNPRLKRSLFNLAEHLREDFEFISQEKARAQRDIVRVKGRVVEMALKDIIVQPRAIQKEILRDSLEKAGGEVKKLSFRHWKEIEALIRTGRKGNSVDLPGSVRAGRTATHLIFRII